MVRVFGIAVLLTVLSGCSDPEPSEPADASVSVHADAGSEDLGPSDSGPPPAVEVSIEGRVVLPPGLEATQVAFGGGLVPVAGGGFTIRTQAGTRRFAVALTAEDTPVAMGFIDAAHLTLSARSTAVAHAYMVTLGPTAPPTYRDPLLDAFEDADALDPLAAAIEAALIESPTALVDRSQEVFNAGLGAARALLDAEQGGLSIFSLLVDGGPRSGIQLDTVSGLNELTLTNRFRRPAFAFIDRVSTVTNGVESASPAVRARKPVAAVGELRDWVATTAQILAGWRGLGDISGSENIAYVPRSTGPFILPHVEGTARTRYRVAVVGPGMTAGDEEELRSEERQRIRQLQLEFLATDIAIPVIFGVILPNLNVEAPEGVPGWNTLVADMAMIIGNLRTVNQSLERGDIVQACAEVWNAIVSSGVVQASVLNAVVNAFPNLATSAGGAQAVLRQGGQLLSGLGFVNQGFILFDQTAIGRHLAASDRANIWTVDTTPPVVRLDPRLSQIGDFEEVALTVNIPEAGPNDTFDYRFSVETPALGELVGAQQRGAQIRQSSPRVTFVAEGTPATARVRVRAFLVDNQNRVEVGTGLAEIEILELDREASCTNGIDDDDLDQFVDCFDRDCADHPACRIEFSPFLFRNTVNLPLEDRYSVIYGWTFTPPPWATITNVDPPLQGISGRSWYCAGSASNGAPSAEDRYGVIQGRRIDCTDALYPELCPDFGDQWYLLGAQAGGSTANCTRRADGTGHCNEEEAVAFISQRGLPTISDLIVNAGANSNTDCDKQVRGR